MDYEVARSANTRAYWGAPEPTSAEQAINRAVAASNVVQSSFNLLGYGPAGGFESEVLLASGENWEVSASVVGAVSQTDFAAGAQRSLSGRGTINIVGGLAPGLAAGLGLGFGVTSDDGATLDDQAQHFVADLLMSYAVTPSLSLDGGVGLEITNHNYTQGAGAGSGLSYLYSGNVGLSGSMDVGAFAFAPSIKLSSSHASQQAITLSNGTVVPGFEKTSGTVTAGGVISHSYVVSGANSAMLVTPSLGADLQLTLAHLVPTSGATTTTWSVGAGATAGIGMEFEGGLNLDFSARVSRTGDTTGASLSGKVGAAF